MTEDTQPPRRTLKRIRTLLWIVVAIALLGTLALLLIPRAQSQSPEVVSKPAPSTLGGPFTLVGADGRPFSSAKLAGKPYAIYFGYTQCGDVCPTTLARLVKLRKQAADEAKLDIVFVTIDPKNDGPREVGQYAELFGSPIIGLTGTEAQIERVKKQYGIFAAPEPMADGQGMKMEHTATVLLFGRDGKLSGTIATDEPDRSALAKMKNIAA